MKDGGGLPWQSGDKPFRVGTGWRTGREEYLEEAKRKAFAFKKKSGDSVFVFIIKRS